MVNPYGWHQMSEQEVSQVHARLGVLEKSTWREIFSPRMGKPLHHLMPVNEICKEAQSQLDEKNLAGHRCTRKS